MSANFHILFGISKPMTYLCSPLLTGVFFGEMLEWLKRHAWKACIRQKRIPSSNLGLSAKIARRMGELFSWRDMRLTPQADGISVLPYTFFRRRSVFFPPPATEIGHRRQKVSQVQEKMRTCDASARDLRHIGPTTPAYITFGNHLWRMRVAWRMPFWSKMWPWPGIMSRLASL